MYIIIDNYDSFTYNIYQYLSELTEMEIHVFRNNEVSLEMIAEMAPRGIIISPGPGIPADAGISVDVINHFKGKVPLLGICLGHQCIGYALGGKIIQAKNIVHGKSEPIKTDGKGVFRGIVSPSCFTRYHSLVLDPGSIPDDLEISAWSDDGEVMGIRHKEYIMEGVQFHPESMASEYGKKLLNNFLKYKRKPFFVKDTLVRIIRGVNLSKDEASEFMEELTEGNLSTAQIAGYLTAFNAKGITSDEIAGCASVLQAKRVRLDISKPLLDTCGTGGDGLGTFNISSFTALIASACGAVVAKHGNKAVSSISGSADFYRELGIKIDISPDKAAGLIEDNGFSFLFAPLYHGAMRHAAAARKELKIKTIMNLLGPLVNPASAEYQLIGVYSDEFSMTVAKAAHILGIKRVMVVHGTDGLDEISVSAPSRIVMIDEEGNITDKIFNPEDIGIRLYKLEELRGGSAAENAVIAGDLLAGKGPDAIREAVLVNAGAALMVYGFADSIEDGYKTAKENLMNGVVKEKVTELIKASNACG